MGKVLTAFMYNVQEFKVGLKIKNVSIGINLHQIIPGETSGTAEGKRYLLKSLTEGIQ